MLDDVPEAAREVALAMRDALLHRFGADLAAVWLYGASVFGPHILDIDLHVFLRRRPTANELELLEDLDAEVSRKKAGGREIDCWYVLVDDGRSAQPPLDLTPRAVRDDHWALHRAHWLAGACIVVYGLEPREVVVPPTWRELEGTLRLEAVEAGRHLHDGSAYWTLQLCRILASLETRDVVRSKIDSGAWATERLGEEVAPIVEAATRIYEGTPLDGDAEFIRRAYPKFYALIAPLIERLPPLT